MSIPNGIYRQAFYLKQYQTLSVEPWAEAEARDIAGAINQNIAAMGLVAAPFGIKAVVPGILLSMEASMDFTKHLANGDPLSEDTVHVPAGLMAKYRPDLHAPYDFIQAGIAALDDYREGWGSLKITDIPSMLRFFDQYNGLGPWKYATVEADGSLSPQIAYLFSGTSAYTRGKMIADDDWDQDAVSRQVGCAAIMKALGL